MLSTTASRQSGAQMKRIVDIAALPGGTSLISEAIDSARSYKPLPAVSHRDPNVYFQRNQWSPPAWSWKTLADPGAASAGSGSCCVSFGSSHPKTSSVRFLCFVLSVSACPFAFSDELIEPRLRDVTVSKVVSGRRVLRLCS